MVGAHLVKHVYYQTSFKEYCGQSESEISCILFLQIGISGNGSWDLMNVKRDTFRIK